MRTLKSGFTLIELLLGLAIAAIIGLSIYNMFWSAMKLDDRMRHVYDTYIELLMADHALTCDLENAVPLDYSASYPDAVIFDGQKEEFSFITQTPKGLKRVRYYMGTKSGAAASESQIGRIVNSSNPAESQEAAEFLLRQESSLGDWLNETSNDTSVQIVAGGIKKGSFSCQYAPMTKDLHTAGAAAIDYEDTWDKAGLPLVVSCSFILVDPQHTQQGLEFKRDIFLAPVPGFYHAQQ